MSESHITFAPSYKFQANETSSTDLSTGLEILPYVTTHRPSWCDRIFYYAKEGYNSDSRPLQVTKYDCEFKCVLSDHKPVFATVLAEVSSRFILNPRREFFGQDFSDCLLDFRHLQKLPFNEAQSGEETRSLISIRI